MTVLAIADLTTVVVEGTGIFDVLMRANKAHLDAEFRANRIKGAEYATVYLGTLQPVLQTAMAFLVQNQEAAQKALLMAQQLELLKEQTANAVLEGKVLVATECKLRAEYDLTMANVIKAGSENAFVLQKKATEQAQTVAAGVDADSVVGRQKALYAGQTAGFQRDAEQKAAQILVETWKVRRTTDEVTVAGVDPLRPNAANNRLGDADIGLAVSKLMAGAGI